MAILFAALLFVGTGLALAWFGASMMTAAVVWASVLTLATIFGWFGAALTAVLWVMLGIYTLALAWAPTRKAGVTRAVFGLFQKIMPPMSATEKSAIEAGDVTWEGQLFSGRPDWSELHNIERAELTDEEQAFIDGPTEKLCTMLKEWRITQDDELPAEAWTFIREQGFMGLIIDKQYGGKGFSERAHSEVLLKIGAVSPFTSTVVAVPNSLGPGKLLKYYGTEEQKNHYLPRLAVGKDIPCFGLTAPTAGSDATSIPDKGIVCMGDWEGKQVLGMRLTWSKRYITLAPVATVLGLAFKLHDPDGLLAKNGSGEEGKVDYGITCALIPTNTPGVEIGRRHRPAGGAFHNGPTSGNDVFVPIDYIIGGPKMAGHGWRMLVEQLSVGRAISLPTAGTGTARMAALTTGAYARVRKQFGLPIAEFEGVGDALTRLAGRAYMAEATRVLTLSLIDKLGAKPSVASAILKYHLTDMGQKSAIDGMDVQAGKAVMTGPKNLIAGNYLSAPVLITVEGANILTRSMIIYGQGAIRCHPFVLKEMQAAERGMEALDDFDAALWGHLGLTLQSGARALVLGLTGSRLADAPSGTPLAGYYRQLQRYSAMLLLMSDTAMFTLGGSLKFREQLSARLGDLLSYLYIGSAVLKHFDDQGQQAEDRIVAEWSLQWLLFQLQTAADGVLRNLPNRVAATLLRPLVFPLGRRQAPPTDAMGAKVAALITRPSGLRERLAENLHVGKDNPDFAPGQLFRALPKVIAVAPLEAKLAKAVRKGILTDDPATQLAEAQQKTLLSSSEVAMLEEARALVAEIIAVDDFHPNDFLGEPSAYSNHPDVLAERAEASKPAAKQPAARADDAAKADKAAATSKPATKPSGKTSGKTSGQASGKSAPKAARPAAADAANNDDQGQDDAAVKATEDAA